jgi:hypothetical protein
MAHAIALGALIVLLLWPGAVRSDRLDEPVEPRVESALCKPQELQLNEPAGWTSERKDSPDTHQVALHPPAGSKTSQVSLDFTLARAAGGRVRVEDALHRAVSHMGAWAGPPDIRPFAAPHPTLRSAGGAVRLPVGQAYVVALGGAGDHYLIGRLTKSSGDASVQELALFRRTLASVRIAPGAGCVASSR